MTASALAVHTDAQKDGKPLIGLAFDSIGRYGHGGLLRERFIPRLLAADPDDYSDGDGGIDPHRGLGRRDARTKSPAAMASAAAPSA